MAAIEPQANKKFRPFAAVRQPASSLVPQEAPLRETQDLCDRLPFAAATALRCK